MKPDANRQSHGQTDINPDASARTPPTGNRQSSADGFQPLLDRIRSGDHEAVGELAAACRDYLLLIANQELDRDLGQKVGPSDVVQNTMVAIHEHVHGFKGDCSEQFLAWIRQILLNDLNRVRREFKKTAKRDARREQPLAGDSRIGVRPIDVRDVQWTPQTKAVRNEEQRLVELAMQRLPEDYRQVIRMRNAEQLTFAEIGQQLQRSDDAAQKLWTRAIEKLKLELKALNAI